MSRGLIDRDEFDGWCVFRGKRTASTFGSGGNQQHRTKLAAWKKGDGKPFADMMPYLAAAAAA
jgi:hypothetical protein